jgi:Mor family transcriptional regulator
MHTKRNRDILASFEAGATVEQLAREHGLTTGRVRAVLNDERHRQAISPKPFYRKIRQGWQQT